MLPDASDDERELENVTKVFYCSRTHSQLIQFASEVRRVKMPAAVVALSQDDSTKNVEDKPIEEIKHLALGSRKNLCINPKVSSLGNATAINERCLELQQSKTTENSRCKFLPTRDSEPLVHQFRDHALAKIRDIEDLGALGKKIGICPYYASRATIKPSEVGTLIGNIEHY